MKALRITMYNPALEPMTIVLLERDLSVPLAEVQEYQPGAFTIFDEFETENDGMIDLSVEADTRQQDAADDETNLAVFYYWNAQQLGRLREGGSLGNPAPAPLSADMLRLGLTQLALHPNYRAQRVVCHSMDGETVVLTGGEIS